MGMAMVSSVNLEVKVGDKIQKGDPVAYFQFGGSDIVSIFQPKAGLKAGDFQQDLTLHEGKQYNFYGSTLAVCPPIN